MCDSCAPRFDDSPAPEADLREQARALHQRIGLLVQLQRRAARELALSFARMAAGGLCRELGYAGIVEYGECCFGFSSSKSRQLERLGRRLPGLPALDSAMCEGSLGWTKARTLIQVVTPETEEAWVERALEVSNRQLEELVARSIHGDEPPEPDDDWEPERYLWLQARMDPLHFQRFMQAVQQLRHRLGDPYISVSQAMLLMADMVLDGEPEVQEEPDEVAQVCNVEDAGPNAFGHTTRIIAHRCPECERTWVESRAGRIELNDEDRELIECDAEVLAGDDSAGTPGHVTRTIPPATRRAVLIRDGLCCTAPGCRNRKHLELHHIVPRFEGGDHSPENLTTVCWAHHDMIHKGVIDLRRGSDGALEWNQGFGEPLALRIIIQGEGAELGHEHLEDLEGLGEILEDIFGEPEELAHVCQEEGLAKRYPRGRQFVRLGDESRMAPAWYGGNVPIICALAGIGPGGGNMEECGPEGGEPWAPRRQPREQHGGRRNMAG